MTTHTTHEALAALIAEHFETNPKEPLIIHGLMEKLYRDAEGENVSRLKPMAESARKYRWEADHPKEATLDMIYGTCVHAALLEPDRLPGMIVARPAKWKDWRTDASQEWRDSQTALVITPEKLEEVHACAASVRADPKAAWILARAGKEVSVWRRHERTGLLLKARIDMPFTDLEDRTAIADLKKVVSVREHKVIRAVSDRYYDMQGAFYCDMIGASSFYLIGVEGTGCHDVDIFQLDDWLPEGRALYEALLDRLVACTKANRWPGVSEDSTTVKRLKRPSWVEREVEELATA